MMLKISIVGIHLAQPSLTVGLPLSYCTGS